MHTNQQTIKKNYLNQIKEIFLASRVDNSRSFFFFLLSMIFQAIPLHYRVRVGIQINKSFVLRTLDRYSQHMRSRGLDGGKTSETFSLFFPLIFYHPLTPRVLPLFIICLELISTIGSSDIFKY